MQPFPRNGLNERSIMKETVIGFATMVLAISSLGLAAPAHTVGHYMGTGTYGGMNMDTGKFGKDVLPIEIIIKADDTVDISINNGQFFTVSNNLIGNKYFTLGYAISNSNIVIHKAKFNGKASKVKGVMTQKSSNNFIEFKYKLTKM